MHRAAIREDGGGFSASSFSLEAVCPDYAILLIKTCLQHHLSPRICLTTAGLQATGRLQPAIWEVCSLGGKVPPYPGMQQALWNEQIFIELLQISNTEISH